MDNSTDNLEYLKKENEHLKYVNSELNLKLDEKTEELSDNKLHFKALRSYIKELEKQKQELINKNDENNNNIQGMQEQLQNNKLEMHTLTEENIRLNFVIEKEKQSYIQLEQKCDQIDEQLKNSNNLIQAANQDRDLTKTSCGESQNIANKLYQLQALKDSEEKALKEQIIKLNREITDLKSSKDNLVISKDEEFVKISGELKNLKEERDNLQNNFNEENKKFLNNEEQIKTLNSEIVKLTKYLNEYSGLDEKLDDAEKNVLLLRKYKQLGERTNMIQTKTDDVNNLQEKNQQLLAEKNNHEKSLNESNDKIENFETKISKSNDIILQEAIQQQYNIQIQNHHGTQLPNISSNGPFLEASKRLCNQALSQLHYGPNSTNMDPNYQNPVRGQQMVPKWNCPICNQNFESEREMDVHVVGCNVQTFPPIPTFHPFEILTQRPPIQKPDSFQLEKPLPGVNQGIYANISVLNMYSGPSIPSTLNSPTLDTKVHVMLLWKKSIATIAREINYFDEIDGQINLKWGDITQSFQSITQLKTGTHKGTLFIEDVDDMPAVKEFEVSQPKNKMKRLVVIHLNSQNSSISAKTQVEQEKKIPEAPKPNSNSATGWSY